MDTEFLKIMSDLAYWEAVNKGKPKVPEPSVPMVEEGVFPVPMLRHVRRMPPIKRAAYLRKHPPIVYRYRVRVPEIADATAWCLESGVREFFFQLMAGALVFRHYHDAFACGLRWRGDK